MSTETLLPTGGGVFVLIISATDMVLTSIESKLKNLPYFICHIIIQREGVIGAFGNAGCPRVHFGLI